VRGLTGICFVAFFLLGTAGCSAQSAAKKSSPQESPAPEAATQLSPDAQKLQRVFASLSSRARDGIVNGDPEEFLRDVQAVLAADTDDLLRLVDKQHALPDGYAPADIVRLVKNSAYGISRGDLSLRACAEKALTAMALAAQKDGAYLTASSSYRTYEYQVEVYERNVRLSGRETADRESAQPGKSQHQLGTVIDFGSITDEYAQTTAGKWLLAHAGEYGWSLSFPDGYEDVTGYRWECWHYRYIGVEAARFQQKWFSDIQQFMLEFIYAWLSA
jgi:D-alanyl-D-alanine carboxypeptidase